MKSSFVLITLLTILLIGTRSASTFSRKTLPRKVYTAYEDLVEEVLKKCSRLSEMTGELRRPMNKQYKAQFDMKACRENLHPCGYTRQHTLKTLERIPIEKNVTLEIADNGSIMYAVTVTVEEDKKCFCFNQSVRRAANSIYKPSSNATSPHVVAIYIRHVNSEKTKRICDDDSNHIM